MVEIYLEGDPIARGSVALVFSCFVQCHSYPNAYKGGVAKQVDQQRNTYDNHKWSRRQADDTLEDPFLR